MNISHQSYLCRSSSLIIAILSIGIALTTQLYTYIVYQALIEQNMHGATGLARAVIPDTFLYKNILEKVLVGEMSIGELLVFSNYIGPVFMWYLAGDNWYSIAAVNGFVIFVALLYLFKFCRFYNLKLLKTMIILTYIGISPIIIYYSTGALKELPCLLGILGFLYHYLNEQKKSWIFYAFILIFFRLQLVVPIALFIIFDRVVKNQLKASILTILIAAALYPFIEQFSMLAANTTELFREDQTSTVGSYIEEIRRTIPIVSMFAVLLRIIQVIFEPFLKFIKNPTFYEYDDLSVYLLSNFIQNLVLAPFWILAIIGIIRRTFTRKKETRDIERVYSFMVLFVGFVAGFSFISHRYLFPIIGIVLIAGLLEHKKMAFRTMTKSRYKTGIDT